MICPGDRLAQAKAVHRRLLAQCARDGVGQVVFVTRGGAYDMAPVGGRRLEALYAQDGFSRRIVGSFTASASVALLASAMRAVV